MNNYKLNLFLLITFYILLLSTANAEPGDRDTVVLYYRYFNNGYFFNNGYKIVNTIDSCDFIRMITSPDSLDNRYNVKDYYKNGKIKFIAKTTPKLTKIGGEIAFDGDCINFDQNGKRISIVHYKEGYKDGNETTFYPNGKVHSVVRNAPFQGSLMAAPLNWECYDKNGAVICKEGNGRWLIYDNEFKNIIMEGPVKNGRTNGEWHGGMMRNTDSIKYICKYKNGILQSGKGYDNTGKEYPFEKEIEPAYYWSGPFQFLRAVQTHLILPLDENGKKMFSEDVIVAFVVEKDGHIAQLEMLTKVDPRLQNAISAAFSKCKNWTPRKNYGIPVRARITLGLKYLTRSSDKGFTDEIFYGEQQIGD